MAALRAGLAALKARSLQAPPDDLDDAGAEEAKAQYGDAEGDLAALERRVAHAAAKAGEWRQEATLALLDVAYAVASQPPAVAAAAPAAAAAPPSGVGAQPPAAEGDPGAQLAGRLLALQRRTRDSTRDARRLTFSLAPLPSYKTHFLHFDNTTIANIHYDLCGADRHVLAAAPRCTTTPRNAPVPARASPAWEAFFKPSRLGRNERMSLADDEGFASGAFSGHIATDGVSIHICRKSPRAARGEGAVPADARAEGGARKKKDATDDLAPLRKRLERLGVFRALSDAYAHAKGFLGAPMGLIGLEALGQLGVRICAVDPGLTDWVTAFALSPFNLGRQPVAEDGLRAWLGERTFVENTQGWRDATGQAAAARQAQKRLRRADPVDRARGMYNIPSGRTVCLSAFTLHCRRKLAGFDAGRRLYGSKRAREARLRKRILRLRHFHRLAQTLAWGSTSVTSKRWSNPPRRPVPNKPRFSIIAWGAASVGAGGPISRKGMGPSRDFERFVRSHYGELGVFFLRIDEYCTSKVCTACWQTNHADFVVGGRPTHKLQVCKDHAPQLVVDRDVSASIAIMVALLERLLAGGAPAWNRRPS